MKTHLNTLPFGPAINRLFDVMEHSERFSFRGVTRLAQAAHVSPSSVSRLINGNINPSFMFVARITSAVEAELGMRIDPREIVAEHGDFLTRYVCDLMHCSGCLPRCALSELGECRDEFLGIKPGEWETSAFPRGFWIPKGGA